VRLAGPAVAATLLASTALAGDGREAGTAALLQTRVKEGEPGLAALVRQDGKTVFSRGYGLRDIRSRRAVDAATGFRLASVTKQFTATAVMLLVKDGKLRYDQALTDVFPSFPAYGRGITVRHLLTHTSGLPDYEELMSAAEKAGARPWTAERQIQDDEVLALLRGAKGGLFAPGTSWAYSNSGYVLLGLVVARVSGEPFDEFLRQRVFAPLGMDRTLAFVRGKTEVPDRAFGHARDGDGFREADQSPTSATLGDGGVYSNLGDLAAWDEALRTSALLSPARTKPALAPATLADGSPPRWPPGPPGGDNLHPGEPVSYGFGWFLDPWRGRARQWHHGSTSGFRSVIERFPDEGVTVVILANRDDLDLQALALEVAEPYLAGVR
jgi:CubicO group peptidase (beta-lactamase class C family)